MIELEKIGQGAATKVYYDGKIAIKLYENASPDEADNEAERQRFAADAGLAVPAVIDVRRLAGNAVALEMEYINGGPIIQPKMDREQRMSAIHKLVELQCTVHKVTASGQPKQTDHFRWKIKQTQHLCESDREHLLMLLQKLDTGADNLCHGDFHPLNILYDGRKYWIIDWADAAAGSPLADACRTYLIFKQYMARSAGIYLRLFCREANVKQEDIIAWMPIVAAARLDEKMDDKSRLWMLELMRCGGGRNDKN